MYVLYEYKTITIFVIDLLSTLSTPFLGRYFKRIFRRKISSKLVVQRDETHTHTYPQYPPRIFYV